MYKPIEDGTEIICFVSNEAIIRYTLHASSLNMRDNRTREVTVPTNFKIQLTNSIKYRGLRKIYSSGFHSWESCYTHHTSEHGILSWFPWVCGSDLWKGMSKPLPTAGLCTYLFFLTEGWHVFISVIFSSLFPTYWDFANQAISFILSFLYHFQTRTETFLLKSWRMFWNSHVFPND